MCSGGIKAHYVIEDAVEHLYDVSVFGKTILTTVTRYPEAVREWMKDVQPDEPVHRYIGLDVELFSDEHRRARIGTLQLCVGNRCLVIQLFRTLPYPTSLGRFLTDKNNTFVGIDLEPKLNLLMEQFPVEGSVKFRDLGEVAANMYQCRGLVNARQSTLVRTAFGMEVEKPRVQPDWGRRANLSDAQVHYACIDAFVSFELGRWLIRDPK